MREASKCTRLEVADSRDGNMAPVGDFLHELSLWCHLSSAREVELTGVLSLPLYWTTQPQSTLSTLPFFHCGENVNCCGYVSATFHHFDKFFCMEHNCLTSGWKCVVSMLLFAVKILYALFFLSLSLTQTDNTRIFSSLLFLPLSLSHTQRHLSSSSIYGNSIFTSFGFFFSLGRYFNPFWHPMTSFIPNHVTKLKTVNKINSA